MMAITRANVLAHELIGLNATLVRATARHEAGMSGRVVDETKNTLVLETARGEKRLSKKGAVFRIALPSGEKVDVDGDAIAFAPEERPKKLFGKKV